MLLVLVPVLVMEVAVRSRENRMRMALMMALPLTKENRDKRHEIGESKTVRKKKEGRKCHMKKGPECPYIAKDRL